MWLRVRQATVIAAVALASLLLSRAGGASDQAAPHQATPAPAAPEQATPQASEQAPEQAPEQASPEHRSPKHVSGARAARGHARKRATPTATKAAAPPPEFGFADVRELAHKRAAHEFHPPPATLPAALANLTYDQYRDIRFRPASALWHGQSLFEVEFFHRGYRTRQRVNIFEVSPDGVTPVAYNPQFFTFGRLLKPPKAPANLGYAGFRVHYPLQSPLYKDELMVFLGASYFRVLGRNQHYGASARGLAIDTAEQSGEEFPTFTDFWLVRPRPTERSLRIYALLDSRSVAGAYQFDIHPGDMTQVEVHGELYLRRAVAKLGVAPLTSMFLYGEDGSGRHFDDYRPQVHDSDGLMNETGHGQWIFRPLNDPRDLRVNRFMDENPRGFGLIQRERAFAHYEDAEAQYQARPSYWVQPLGDWGKGGVELVEIPSDEEIHDNIVAYWVPAQSPQPGKPLSFAYVLSAFAQSPLWPPGGRAVATRSGSPATGDNRGHFAAGARRMLVDFAGGDLEGLAGVQPVKAELTAQNAQLQALTVQRIAESGAWRVAFVVTPRQAKKPVDLQCYLTLYGEVLSETWVYQWTP